MTSQTNADRAPLVSVVTPSFNSAQYIEQTIQSVLSQDSPQIEYLIVDGGSRDGTLDILKRYSGRVQWTSEPDRGMYDAVNKGWRRARGQYVMYVNSDDLLCPGALHLLVRYLEEHPECEMVYGDCYRINEEGEIIERLNSGQATFEQLLNYGNNIFSGTILLRRSLLDRVGSMDSSLSESADYDFCLRAAYRRTLGYIPEPIAMFRMHSGQLTRTTWNQGKEGIAISRKYGGHRYSPLYFMYLANRFLRLFPPSLTGSRKLLPARQLLRRMWHLSS
jgi:glycosyltransferase involved in cell wall biosynthesis